MKGGQAGQLNSYERGQAGQLECYERGQAGELDFGQAGQSDTEQAGHFLHWTGRKLDSFKRGTGRTDRQL